jgi:hypothetical protein
VRASGVSGRINVYSIACLSHKGIANGCSIPTPQIHVTYDSRMTNRRESAIANAVPRDRGECMLSELGPRCNRLSVPGRCSGSGTDSHTRLCIQNHHRQGCWPRLCCSATGVQSRLLGTRTAHNSVQFERAESGHEEAAAGEEGCISHVDSRVKMVAEARSRRRIW